MRSAVTVSGQTRLIITIMGLSEQWLDYLRDVRAMSPNTVATYGRTLRAFPDIATADRDRVEQWWSSRSHLAVSSRLNELACLRSFYAWCRRFEHRGPTDDPTHRIESPRKPKSQPRPVSRADLTRLLARLDGIDRRAVALGAYAGLRIAEVAVLDWADLDLEANRIYVRGKGNKERQVGLSPLLLDSLLPRTGGNVATAGERAYTAATLQRRVNRAIQGAGVEATFHQLRHRFGTVAVAATGNLLAVSRAMGHESPATTSIYVASSDSDLDMIAEAVSR